MTNFVSNGTWNLNSINQSVNQSTVNTTCKWQIRNTAVFVLLFFYNFNLVCQSVDVLCLQVAIAVISVKWLTAGAVAGARLQTCARLVSVHTLFVFPSQTFQNLYTVWQIMWLTWFYPRCYVSFSALTLLVGWQEIQPIINLCHLPQGSFGTDGGSRAETV